MQLPKIRTAVILAAGLGTRLGDKTEHQPKGFLEIDGQSLIERSIQKLIEVGMERVVIGTGYLHHFFDRLKHKYHQIETCRSPIFAETGSMYTLYNARDLLEEDFLLLESDLLYDKLGLNEILSDQRPDVILGSGFTKSDDEVFIEADEKHHLINMSKKREELNSIYAELVGINKISFETFQIMCQYCEKIYETDKSIHYEDAFVGISTVKDIFIKKLPDYAWCEIDDENHLRRALELVYPKILASEKGAEAS
ncbi:phosphocholine cytidylyltransferase family protein [Fulvivirgaceae bacterium BMA10]|uniref:Phosphocholine cytidylyltransferase family protein n=1 Tax=Splendidivirga corallicola TaxID=3051826 RepID=A0ABT8KWK0_9BACT|nr:phosphocholine cytidylyltransferase family protein [Fulvivirgaceae bacterium BMA10]